MTFNGSRKNNELSCEICDVSISDGENILEATTCPVCGSDDTRFGENGDIFIGYKKEVGLSCGDCEVDEGNVV